jgi:hypothetical protein
MGVVRGLGVQLVRTAELGGSLYVLQLARLESVGEIAMDGCVEYAHPISAGPSTETDQ